MKNSKKCISLLLIFIMLSAAFFTACVTQDEQPGQHVDSETNNEIIDEETQAKTKESNKISNGKYSITVPDSWEGKYTLIMDDESIQLYQKAAYESFGGGYLCSFVVFEDSSYTEIPCYNVILRDELDGQTYIVMYPSDVQADLDDEESATEYFKMTDELPQIVKSFVLG
ncbi:MAG: hypothetical protein ACI4U1_05860 [Anaerovoracaceae bacterium]